MEFADNWRISLARANFCRVEGGALSGLGSVSQREGVRGRSLLDAGEVFKKFVKNQ